MTDLDKALADILTIRSQIAAGTAFRGYGPLALAATGGLALITATAQSLWLGPDPVAYLAGWAATALIASALIAIEMIARTRRHHAVGGLGDAMLRQAVLQFLPAGVSGLLLCVVFVRVAPESLWLLPGLWQILVSLGIFASRPSLPPAMAAVGVWYLLTGLMVLTVTSATHALSPWSMGLPFAIGQGLSAFLIWKASRHD